MTMAEIRCPTVVITGYEGFTREGGSTLDLAQLRIELQQEFSDLISAVIHYNSTFDQWKTVLTRTLLDVVHGKA
jgi:hypothetical protein